MTTLRLGTEGWKLVFRLPTVGGVGGEILFRLRILLVPAVESSMGPPCCNKTLAGVCFECVYAFIVPFVFLFDVIMG
jgi:hypothetical protein